jgi:hypothetical protein
MLNKINKNNNVFYLISSTVSDSEDEEDGVLFKLSILDELDITIQDIILYVI